MIINTLGNQFYKEEDYITGNKFLNFSNTFEAEKVKYYKHDFLFKNGIWRDKLVKSCINNKSEIIIVGHSDFSMTDEIALKIKKETNCKAIYAINNESSFPWVISLPLGLGNDSGESFMHIVCGKTKILIDIQSYNPPLINKLYMNISINTNSYKRQPIYDYLSKQPFVTVGKTEYTLSGRENFFKDIKKHIFVACPEGNGLDTHRLWETLYCGRIPIVLKNRIHSFWMENKNIPICWIDSWFDITEDFLDKEFEKLKNKIKTYHHELSIEYWKDKIKNTLDP